MKKEIKNSKLFKLLKPTVALFSMSIIAISSTFAWMRREYTPSVGENGIQIVAGSALLFSLEDSEGAESTDEISFVDLAEKAGISEFRLKPVSNATGKIDSFYNITYAPDDVDNESTKLNNSFSTYGMADGLTYGYIDVTFYVQSDTKNRYVYLEPKSRVFMSPDYINSKAYKAIRLCIEDRKTGVIYMFCPCGDSTHEHQALTGAGKYYTSTNVRNYDIVTDVRYSNLYDYMGGYYKKVTQGEPFRYSIEDEKYYVPYGEQPSHKVVNGYVCDENGARITNKRGNSIQFTGTEPLYNYAPVTGEYTIIESLAIGERNYNNIQSGQTLFQIAAGDVLTLRVAIWLEGEDQYCTDEVINTQLDVLLMFASVSWEAE